MDRGAVGMTRLRDGFGIPIRNRQQGFMFDVQTPIDNRPTAYPWPSATYASRAALRLREAATHAWVPTARRAARDPPMAHSRPFHGQ